MASWLAIALVWGAASPLAVRAQDGAVQLAGGDQPPDAEDFLFEPDDGSAGMEELAPPPSQAPAPAALEITVTTETPAAGGAPEGGPTEDGGVAGEEELPDPPQEILLHGFRLGYLYVNDTASALDSRDPSGPTYQERYDMRTPHLFMLGYELTWRMIGHEWLNVLLTGNILIAGLEQARVFPSANLIIGFEFARLAQVGIGVSVTPTKEEPAHMVIAAGFTPRIGSFYTPLHAFFVPDIDGHHKVGITVGINFF